MGEGTITEEKNYQRGFMKSLFDNIQSLIILILIIIILLMRACDGGGNQIDIDEDTKIIKVDTIVKVDTVEVEKEIYIPKWKTKVVTKVDTVEKLVLQDVDTLKILEDYYELYAYQDTLTFDTLGYAVVKDTITENSILNRQYTYKINKYTNEIEIVRLIDQTEFYIGVGSRVNGRLINYMGVEGLMRSKKGNTIMLGVGLNEDQEFTYGGGIYWKFLSR